MKQFNFTLDQIYEQSSKLLEVTTDNAHVGMIGISQCQKLIRFFIEMRGESV